nr:D-alanyl-D-alanine endopeptidase [Burkholderia ubonensis]
MPIAVACLLAFTWPAAHAASKSKSHATTAPVAHKNPARAKPLPATTVKRAATRHGGRAGTHKASGAIRKVAFSPRRAPEARSFELTPSPRSLALRSNNVLMVDDTTGETLFDKNAQAVVPIASVTKLMTAMVVLDANAPLDEPIQVTEDDRDYEKFTGSRLSVGSTLSRSDMLHIALMSSENRAAAALSRYYPGGRAAFIDAMNRKASALGMTNTHFENPAGLSKNNVSTARDLAKMVGAAYQYPLIREYSTDANYAVDTGRGILRYRSTNILLRDPSWNIDVQKTGFINESGICLVMRVTIEGRPITMVLLDSSGKHSDFVDAARLRTMVMSGETRLTAAGAVSGS